MLGLHTFTARFKMMRRFAKSGYRFSDQMALAVAGFSRVRPFSGNSIYARFGRTFAKSVRLRPRALPQQRVSLDLTSFNATMVYEEIFIDRIYELGLLPFVPDLIVDCGAHIGLFSVYASGCFPDVPLICFEPHPDNIKQLRQHSSLNTMNAALFQCAVSTSSGSANFGGEGFGGSLISGGDTTVEQFSVRVMDLPMFFRSIAISRLLMKMDIEGSESELLPEMVAVLPPVCGIYLETHHSDETVASYFQPLKNAGFSVLELRRRTSEGGRLCYVEWFLLRT